MEAALAPTGEQYLISGEGYRAVVTECGGTLRALEYDGRPLVDGFAEDSLPVGGRGQLLVPWPNRIRDGRYSFGLREHRLGLSEPARHNASHGLVRWVAWHPVEHSSDRVALRYRLMAQSGYPWTLDLQVAYRVSAAGLTVTLGAANRMSGPAPYAAGAHPYLVVGDGPVDRLQLTLPAATQLLTEPERKLPVGRRPVLGTEFDFRSPRPIGGTVLDHAFTDLDRDADGNVVVTLHDLDSGHGVELWADRRHPWLQVYSADDAGAAARRSLAVEPMTAPPDAFRSGADLVVLAPAGHRGDRLTLSWGIRALARPSATRRTPAGSPA